MAGQAGGGVLSVWAEAQRQEQRRRQAQGRAQVAAQRQEAQATRAAQLATARGEREALRAYQQSREAEAAELSGRLDQRVAELDGLLRVGLARPAFSLAPLLTPASLPAAFDPGRLGVPIPMPDPARYQVPAQGGLLQRRRYEEQRAQAQAQYERDWHQAQAAERERLQQLAEYQRGFEEWAAEHRQQDAERIARTRELAERLGRGEDEAVREYFSAVLYGSTDWPEGFPHRITLAWDMTDRQLVLEWELPGFDVVPEHGRVRYVKTDDRQAPVARPAAERKRIYREVLARSVLRVLDELFRADQGGLLDSVALNGLVQGVDPATGREAGRVLVAVTASRAAFGAIALDRVAPVECLEGLGGRLSPRPERLAEVRAERRPQEVGARVLGHGGDDPDLFTMDPIAFEELIAELFRARGYRVATTARSGDEGVDVVAIDPDPVTGGKIVIQAKRYRSTVSPTAVRDLDSTVRHHGAIKGILVTTAHFGRGSYAYIENKPLSLVNGPELVELLAEQGLRGRLGPAPAGPTAGEPTTRASEVRLRIEWQSRTVAGDPVELDVSAFLCADGRVLSDEHFVFFNNPADPGGAVRLGAARTDAGGQLRTAALTLALDQLGPEVQEVAVAVSTEEEPGPALPLGYLHGLALAVTDRASELELHRWADGTSGIAESALELGAFRRSAPDGGWQFEAAARPVSGGLAGLATGRGVAIA
ncbi:restriction endonuclease [Kitasatospora kifunensis]|uniref:Restriction system protein n=1 Tax=Kitasatospora kifunensis TaxID=58351 RepID=A0A7W7R6T8_KITKI|nr:restriction endonuclease [Kitasatospora kifunensis]MBB4926467.1 restriction system protein [Kitasatospora kifunensis]